MLPLLTDACHLPQCVRWQLLEDFQNKLLRQKPLYRGLLYNLHNQRELMAMLCQVQSCSSQLRQKQLVVKLPKTCSKPLLHGKKQTLWACCVLIRIVVSVLSSQVVVPPLLHYRALPWSSQIAFTLAHLICIFPLPLSQSEAIQI